MKYHGASMTVELRDTKWMTRRDPVNHKKYQVVNYDCDGCCSVAADFTDLETAQEFAEEANRLYLMGLKNN